MWGTIPAAAILLAASVLSADFQYGRMVSRPVDYNRAFCVSFLEKGDARPFIAKRCRPGTTFKLGCNRCLCRQSGNTAICTNKNCYQKMLGSACVPGKPKTLECNVCICSPTGRWACTQRHCRPGIRHVPCNTDFADTPDTGTEPQQCVPGSSFMNGCDRCYCANDGVSAVCKSLPCNGVTGILRPLGSVLGGSDNEYPHFGFVSEYVCIPGTTFMDKCNVCKCMPDGKTATCTKKDCPPGSY